MKLTLNALAAACVIAAGGNAMCEGKIAVFADLHYTAESGRIKGEVLRWAVAEAARRGAVAAICAGDMIGGGRRTEAEGVAAILAESAIPVSFTPGNAELRCPEESADVETLQDNLRRRHKHRIFVFPRVENVNP